MEVSGILLTGMIGLFALAGGFGFIFVLYQRRLIAKDLLQQKLENDHQRELLHAIIENQEAERKRIAHDLHDEIGALLTTSRLYFNQLTPGQAEEQLKLVSAKMNLLFDEMLANIRRISHDLRPIILENLGLIEAIESTRHKLSATGIHFEFVHDITFTMTRSAELILYRIFQELVNNTLKHAKASRIALTMMVNGDVMTFSYSDDGIGFSPAAGSAGLGMKSIYSRLNLIGANMKVEKVEKGIRLVMNIHINNLREHE